MVRSVRRCRPPATAIQDWYAGADLLDAYCLTLPDEVTHDARVLARLALAHPPRFFRMLMAARDRIVWPLGIKSSDTIRAANGANARIDFFPVILERSYEVVLGRTTAILISGPP